MFWVYHQLNSWVTTNLGLDSAFAMFLAVSGTTAVLLLLPSIIWYILSGRRLREAAIVAVGFAGLVALLVSTVGRDVCFDRASGRPLCYVAETPEGAQFSRTPGVDPKYGVQFVVYTAEMAVARGLEERQSRQQSEQQRSDSPPSANTTATTAGASTTVVLREGSPYRLVVPPGHRWELVLMPFGNSRL